MAAKKRRRRNPQEQLQLGGSILDQFGHSAWGGRKGPKRPIWTPRHVKPADELYSYPRQELPHLHPKESPARKAARTRAKRKAAELRKAKRTRAARKAAPRRKARQTGKLTGRAKADFLRRMAAGRRAAGRKTTPRKAAAPRRRGKLRGAAKAAFLRRMAAGRRKWLQPSKAYVTRARHRKGVKKHLRAITQIPRRAQVAGLVRLNPRTGALTMTKVANPRKNPKKNPRRRRRARNPSFGGVMASIKSTALPMALGGVAGLGAGYMDSKFLGDKPTISVLTKVLLALAGAAAIGRKHPMAAAGWAGGMVGSTGYHAGVKIGGGMIGLSPSGALKGIADMAADDPAMANLIAGLGDVTDDGLGDAANDYNQILADVDDDMGDVVEAEG